MNGDVGQLEDKHKIEGGRYQRDFKSLRSTQNDNTNLTTTKKHNIEH